MKDSEESRGKKYYRENREKCRERTKLWREKNKEKIREYNKKYRSEHKEEIKKTRSLYYEKNKVEILKKHIAWLEKNRDVVRKTERAWKKEYRVKTGSANIKVKRAIKYGKLTQEKCEVCGANGTEAHHDDYNYPLNVRWLCRKCHLEWHKQNKPIYIGDKDD